MLTGLAIRDFVLVRSLDLDLGEGFTSLTGETGAGKSILMAALGFALGARGRQDQIRPGANAASISASFEPGPRHPVFAFLAERGVAVSAHEPLVFRRTLRRGGSARAFINDQPVGAALLEEAGAMMADIHSQHEGHGLLNVGRHRLLLDAYAEAAACLSDVSRAWTMWRCAEEARIALEERLARAAAERSYLAHALEELDALDPEEGESARLSLDRAVMQAGGRVVEAVDAALHALSKANVQNALSTAARAVSRALALPALNGNGAGGEGAGGALAAKIAAAGEALERAQIETNEAKAALEAAGSASEFSPAALEASEARLFALKAVARKHDMDADQLPGLRRRLRIQLDEIEQSDNALGVAREAEGKAKAAYYVAAEKLTKKRTAAAKKLTAAVGAELPPLKLEKARFRVGITRRDDSEAGPTGLDDIAFEIATVGEAFGPLNRIASGGEMARISLAISVCLAGTSACRTLVFDEADVGVGGAVAAAVGERLARLGRDRQVLAITHSPQVAAAAERQWKIAKGDDGDGLATRVDVLAPKARREEIARMLAGAEVTREARAAADRLLARA